MGGNGTIFRLLLPPDIVGSPKDQTNVIGSTGTFDVAATSLQPLHYQWQKDGINLTNSEKYAGTDSTNLNIHAISESDAGTYSVVVMNSDFSVTNQAYMAVFVSPQNYHGSMTNVNQVALKFIGTPDHFYFLQTTTNLTPPVTWETIVTNRPDGDGNWQFTDTNVNAIQKFYRAVAQ